MRQPPSPPQSLVVAPLFAPPTTPSTLDGTSPDETSIIPLLLPLLALRDLSRTYKDYHIYKAILGLYYRATMSACISGTLNVLISDTLAKMQNVHLSILVVDEEHARFLYQGVEITCIYNEAQ